MPRKKASIHYCRWENWKDSGQVKALIAAGCLAQRYREEIQKEIPQVDAIIGTTAIDEIVAALEEILAGQKQNHYEDINAAPVTETNRVVTTGGHFAYLKIAEGCDKHCTYCIIPKVRGNYRSVPKESLLKEATELGGQRRTGADPGSTGDHAVRYGSVWKKGTAQTFT